MNKRTKTLLGISSVLVVLVVIFFTLSDKEEIEDVAENDHFNELILIDEDADDLIKIELEPEHNYVYTKQNGIWLTEFDKNITLDQQKLNDGASRISSLTTYDIIRSDPTEQELVEFGFDESYKISFIYTNDKIYTIYIGMQSPSGGSSYIMKENDNKIYLIEDYYLENIAAQLNDMIDINIDFPDMNNILTLTIQSSTSGNTIIKKDLDNSTEDDPVYVIAEPFNNRKLELLNFKENLLYPINKITFGTPFYYTGSDDLSEYGFDNPVYTLYIEDDAKKTLSIIVGSEFQEGFHFAKYNDRQEVFVMTDLVLQTIESVDYSAIVDRLIYSPNIIDMKSIIVSLDTDAINLDIDIEKTKEYKELVGGKIEGKTIDTYTVKRLYDEIIALSVNTVMVEYNDYEKNEAAYITFVDDNNKQVTVNYYNYDADNYAVEMNDETVGLIKKVSINNLVTDLKLAL